MRADAEVLRAPRVFPGLEASLCVRQEKKKACAREAQAQGAPPKAFYFCGAESVFALPAFMGLFIGACLGPASSLASSVAP